MITVSFIVLGFLQAAYVAATEETDNPLNHNVNCPEEWYYYGGKCYWYGGQELKDQLTYYEAKAKCAEFGARLPSILSQEEQDFITNYLVLHTEAGTWIGLRESTSGNSYEWDDMSVFNFSAFGSDALEGKPASANCVLMTFLTIGETGRWFFEDCNDAWAYLCEKDPDSSLISHNKMYCSPALGGGYRLHQSCYHLINEPMTWSTAEAFCQNAFSGHLIAIKGFPISEFMAYNLRQLNSSKDMWIGLKATGHLNPLSWISGWPMPFTAWKDTSTYETLVGNTCAVVTETDLWDVRSCEDKYPFICEYSTRQPPKRPPSSTPGSYCPQKFLDWIDIGGDLCYYLSLDDYLSWKEANLFCQRRGGNLASFHSEEIIQMLEPFLHYYRWVYAGLIRHEDGQFGWMDGTPFDFEFWGEGEPDDIAELYSVLQTQKMRIHSSLANYDNPFICSTKKVLPEVTMENELYCAAGESYKIVNL